MVKRTRLRGSAMAGVGAVLLGLTALADPAAAETLTGMVSSQKERSMEGVLVSAKKQGGTISVTVVSNAEGRYSFPGDRLSAGTYDIAIRAVGYTLPATTVAVGAGQATTLDLTLKEVTDKIQLGRQLSNAEWMISAGENGSRLGNCTNCHTLQLPLFSHHDAEAMTKVIQRMSLHTNNSSLAHPWFDTDMAEQLAKPPSDDHASLGTYFASINLSDRDAWPFDLKTLPRPTGADTRVIYTTYDLPRPDAAPHDEAFDADGNVWYSDFNTQYIGKLNPKTGEVKEYDVPLRRPNGVAQGGLQIDLDPTGKVWFANMEQIQLVRLDPATGTMDVFKLPVADEDAADAHTTMIDPSRLDVDGNLWFNVAGGGAKGGEGAWRLHVATGEFTHMTYPEGSPPARAYDVLADSSNNLWGMHMRNHNLWRTDAADLKTEWFEHPDDRMGCRRGHMDSQDRIWCGDFYGNGLVMFNTRTREFEGNWTMPTTFTRPYDAQYDDKAYVWAGGMDSDLIIRLNPQTGKLNQYLLPHETNIRHVEVWKGGPNELSSFWVGDQHGATLTRIEALTP
jgi:virginiamycin B lyase